MTIFVVAPYQRKLLDTHIAYWSYRKRVLNMRFAKRKSVDTSFAIAATSTSVKLHVTRIGLRVIAKSTG